MRSANRQRRPPASRGPVQGKPHQRPIRTIVRQLERVYGPRPWRKHRSGVAGLVQTILSQNTSDHNSAAAFGALQSAFPTWEAVMAAPTSAIERAIRCGGLSRIKAARIKAALRSIQQARGRLSLAFLARWPVPRALAYLQALDGIGPKTACCVLMFCYGRPALPVDTHVHRVARRLALLPERCTAEKAHALLAERCPAALVYPFHVLMVEHGRHVCRARRPRCRDCVLADSCPAARW